MLFDFPPQPAPSTGGRRLATMAIQGIRLRKWPLRGHICARAYCREKALQDQALGRETYPPQTSRLGGMTVCPAAACMACDLLAENVARPTGPLTGWRLARLDCGTTGARAGIGFIRFGSPPSLPPGVSQHPQHPLIHPLPVFFQRLLAVVDAVTQSQARNRFHSCSSEYSQQQRQQRQQQQQQQQ